MKEDPEPPAARLVAATATKKASKMKKKGKGKVTASAESDGGGGDDDEIDRAVRELAQTLRYVLTTHVAVAAVIYAHGPAIHRAPACELPC